MSVCVHHWDSFTRRAGKGNPAGIVLGAQTLSTDDMLAIAARVGFNDTAFVMPSQRADFRIRYFAPRREVALCGHATIAAFAALHRQRALPHGAAADQYTLETLSGILPIGVHTSTDELPQVVMTQGMAHFAKFSGSRADLARAIGIDVSDLHPTLPLLYGSTGRWTLIVPVTDLEVMRRMRPVPELFPTALSDQPGASIHPFCLQTLESQASAHARHFSSPLSGTLEDAVTGTASGVLGAYYRRFIADEGDPGEALVMEQGYEVGREGTVKVWAARQGDDYFVRIAGTACFVRDIGIEI